MAWFEWLEPAFTAAEIMFTPTELNVGEDQYFDGYHNGLDATYGDHGGGGHHSGDFGGGHSGHDSGGGGHGGGGDL